MPSLLHVMCNRSKSDQLQATFDAAQPAVQIEAASICMPSAHEYSAPPTQTFPPGVQLDRVSITGVGVEIVHLSGGP